MAKFSDASAQPGSPYYYSPGVAPYYTPILWDPATQQPVPGQDGANIGPLHAPLKLVPTQDGGWDWQLATASWGPGATPVTPYNPQAGYSVGQKVAAVEAALNDLKAALGIG